MISVVNVFCMEMPIFLREHFNGMYRADVYFLAKQLTELPVFLIQPALNVGILYYMVGLNPAFDRFLVALGVSEILAQTNVSFGNNIKRSFWSSIFLCPGYMISCAAPSLGVALAIGPTMLIPLMIFGGLLLQNSTIPVL